MLPYLEVRDVKEVGHSKKATETLQVLDHITTVAINKVAATYFVVLKIL